MTGPVRTMYAMRAAGPDPARLTGERIPVPEPGTGEVLVEVHATAVTADELTWSDTWPVIPCHDMSGVVVASGGGVTDWPPGAEIYGLIGFDRPGAAAEYVTVPAADLAARPVAANPEEAAALPRRAHRLAGSARPRPAAAGPARPGSRRSRRGRRLRSPARRRTRRPGDRDRVSSAPRFRGRARRGRGHRLFRPVRGPGQRVDVVIDPVGGDALARSWPVLRQGGILVAIADEPDVAQGGRGDVRATYFVVRPDGSQLGNWPPSSITTSSAPPSPSPSNSATYPQPSAPNSSAPVRPAKWLFASTARQRAVRRSSDKQRCTGLKRRRSDRADKVTSLSATAPPACRGLRRSGR